MNQHIAFLRGINVGGHRIKMERLASHFREMGFDDVWTFIASGNVVFSTASSDPVTLKRTIEGHLAEALGYDVATFLRTPTELEATLAWERPASIAPPSSNDSHYVVFLDQPVPESVVSAIQALNSEIDRFYVSDREIHWCIRGKLSNSPLFGPGISKALGALPNTMRNRNTLSRLAAKLEAE